MAKAEELVQRCIHPRDDVAALRLGEPEFRWSYLVFLQVLGKYLRVKAEWGEFDYHFYYARDSVLHYADWMAENEVPYADVLDKVEMPTETWPAQDIRKCHVMHIAAGFSEGNARRRFSERAEFFYRRCLQDLMAFSTAYLVRPRVILAVYGYIQSYVERYGYVGPETAHPGAHGYEFGEPETFAPQRDRLRQDFSRRIAAVISALRRAGGSRFHVARLGVRRLLGRIR